MTVFLCLLGMYLVLHLPVVGHLIGHAILHLIEHHVIHRERGTYILAAGTWAAILVVPAALVARDWFLLGDALLVLLIAWKVLGSH